MSFKDITDKEIEIGDSVAFYIAYDKRLYKGIVKHFTPKRICVDYLYYTGYKGTSYPLTTYIRPDNCVVLCKNNIYY